jgi:beta-mannanase
VHDLFTAAGASNVSWTWCPNIDQANTLQPLGGLYPGDAYVDWTCLDGYNWGTNPAGPSGWRTFDQIYDSTYEKITTTIAPQKPMMIGEVGSSEYGGSKAAWIEDTLKKIPVAYPKIRALLWFDKFDSGMDWPVETSSSATSAFSSAIASQSYVGSQYGALAPTAIAPPG